MLFLTWVNLQLLQAFRPLATAMNERPSLVKASQLLICFNDRSLTLLTSVSDPLGHVEVLTSRLILKNEPYAAV